MDESDRKIGIEIIGEMKVLILSDVNSSHTQKWVTGLRDRGVEVSLFSLTPMGTNVPDIYKGVEVHCMNYTIHSKSLSRKSNYLRSIPTIRKLIRKLKPDILHAHDASSYGIIGAFVGFRNYAISVWGTDVYVFPQTSKFFETLLKFSLGRAKMVFSTSHDMARETSKYYKSEIEVIPFGVDLNAFYTSGRRPEQLIRFASAKSLKPVYNIPLIVDAFKDALEETPSVPMELHIAGEGSEYEKCIQKSGALLNSKIFFSGHVPHKLMPDFFSDKHVLLNIPVSESFGVSVIEASASGMAVIVTNAGGLPEVVCDGVTGMMISDPDRLKLKNAIIQMVSNLDSLSEMGKAGKEFVKKYYDWRGSLDKQLDSYKKMLELPAE